MHLFVCLLSLVLTFHLSSLRASNFTIQNVQESNFSQNISYDDIFENATLEITVEISTHKSKALENRSQVVLSSEVNPEKFLTSPTEPSVTSEILQRQSSTISTLPSTDVISFLTENSSFTSPGADITTDDAEKHSENFSVIASKSQYDNAATENGRDITTEQISASNSVPKTEAAVLKYNTAKIESITTQNPDLLKNVDNDQSLSNNQLDKTDPRTDHITAIDADITSATSENASVASTILENVTSFEETVEHNAILTTDTEASTDKSQNIIVGHKCTRIFQESILWNVTDGGMLALKSCPSGYQGNMYRPCFSNGKWGNVDYSECRLEHLGRMRHMVSYISFTLFFK